MASLFRAHNTTLERKLMRHVWDLSDGMREKWNFNSFSSTHHHHVCCVVGSLLVSLALTTEKQFYYKVSNQNNRSMLLVALASNWGNWQKTSCLFFLFHFHPVSSSARMSCRETDKIVIFQLKTQRRRRLCVVARFHELQMIIVSGGSYLKLKTHWLDLLWELSRHRHQNRRRQNAPKKRIE